VLAQEPEDVQRVSGSVLAQPLRELPRGIRRQGADELDDGLSVQPVEPDGVP